MAKKLKSKKFKEFVTYSSLIEPWSEWGQEFTDEKEMKEFKKHPNLSVLNFGLLFKIWQELKSIRHEIKRERIIK